MVDDDKEVKLTESEIEELLDILVPRDGSIQNFAEITVEDILEACNEDPKVMSAKYVDGTFYLETTEGPIEFNFKGIRSDA